MLVSAREIVFYVGDILHDEALQDVGVLIERYDSYRGYEDQPDSNVAVWKTWWCRAGEEHYSEEGLQNLVDLDVFICYSAERVLKKI